MAGHWGITAGQRGGGADASERPGARRVIVAAAPFPVAAAVVATAYARLAERLPETLATHFRADGHADGFSSAGGFLAAGIGTLLVLGALFGLVVLLPAAGRRTGAVRRTREGRRADGVPRVDARPASAAKGRASAAKARPGSAIGAARAVITVGYGVAGLVAYAFVATLYVNAAAGGDRAAAALPLSQLAAAFGTGVVAAALGRLLAGKDTPLPDDGSGGDAPRLALADSEVAGWSRTISSPVLYALGLVLLAAGLVTGPVAGWSAASGPIVGALLVLALAGLRVAADRRGLTVTPPLLPYPRMRIPLERIREADSREIAALREFGGWGYRMRPGRSGFVLRSGEALSLRLVSGKEFVVTVGDAATAAALLNTLVDRADTGPKGADIGPKGTDAEPEGTA
ncbi:DUF1648 domain-containing protein [Streptomyces olivaceiscleroticus]|uniref:DUF1648 domain-containing protein n=1 Tax=Streptomyces olivaceiscleroticus TaxID=68245 RepID=A0ABP3JPZ3_9ACTN